MKTKIPPHLYGNPGHVVSFEKWDDGDWVVTVAGRPVGQTFSSEAYARNTAAWLSTALDEIMRTGLT
jgi:hypothetical protein